MSYMYRLQKMNPLEIILFSGVPKKITKRDSHVFYLQNNENGMVIFENY